MKKLFLILTIMIINSQLSMVYSQQTDPVLTGMILLYTENAEKQLKAQEKVMMLQTTGHIWLEEEYEKTIEYNRLFNNYLNSFRSVISYVAQIYGFYHEIGRLTENMEKLGNQIAKSPGNAVAVALTPRRNGIYRELVMTSIGIVNDIRQVCLSDIKMTEKERIEIVFGIRPKLRHFNKKLHHLILAVKYTSLSDVWHEIDLRERSYHVDRGRISDEAFRRWRNNGGKIRPGGGSDGGDSNSSGNRWNWTRWDEYQRANDSLLIKNLNERVINE